MRATCSRVAGRQTPRDDRVGVCLRAFRTVFGRRSCSGEGQGSYSLCNDRCCVLSRLPNFRKICSRLSLSLAVSAWKIYGQMGGGVGRARTFDGSLDEEDGAHLGVVRFTLSKFHMEVLAHGRRLVIHRQQRAWRQDGERRLWTGRAMTCDPSDSLRRPRQPSHGKRATPLSQKRKIKWQICQAPAVTSDEFDCKSGNLTC